MRAIIEMCKRLSADQSGLETVEWAVVGGLIVGGIVVVVATLGQNVLTQFTKMSTAIPAN